MAVLGVPKGSVGVIGGTEVFALFLDKYDIFHLSQVPAVRLPGGRPVFPEVPAKTLEEVLTRHGLRPGSSSCLARKRRSRLLNGIAPEAINGTR